MHCPGGIPKHGDDVPLDDGPHVVCYPVLKAGVCSSNGTLLRFRITRTARTRGPRGCNRQKRLMYTYIAGYLANGEEAMCTLAVSQLNAVDACFRFLTWDLAIAIQGAFDEITG